MVRREIWVSAMLESTVSMLLHRTQRQQRGELITKGPRGKEGSLSESGPETLSIFKKHVYEIK